MQNLGEALKEAITSMTFCPSEDHICQICEKVVPRLQLVVLGVEKTVQPRCKCEVEAWEQGRSEAIERKQRNEIERKFSVSSLGDRFNESRFEVFKPRLGTERAFQLSRDYANGFPDYGGDALLIWGEPGNGKSFLAAAIFHEVKERGFIPVFQSVPELLERIRSTFHRDNKETEKEIMVALLECDLLVLDDIGAEKVSDWVQDVLFRIIDGRYRQKKPTLYTSNLKPSDLAEKIGKRIYDRMIETSIAVENKATSYRMEVAKSRYAEMQRSG